MRTHSGLWRLETPSNYFQGVWAVRYPESFFHLPEVPPAVLVKARGSPASATSWAGASRGRLRTEGGLRPTERSFLGPGRLLPLTDAAAGKLSSRQPCFLAARRCFYATAPRRPGATSRTGHLVLSPTTQGPVCVASPP